MPANASLLGFVAASLVLLLIPGPAVVYVIARSISQGQRAGLVSVLGLSTGALVHVAGATLGLSAILMASATAFDVVKALGAAYLIYLGVRALLSRESTSKPDTVTPRPLFRLFRDGFVISVLNPKIAVFFLAFLPQFADPGRGSVQQQVLFLGLLYVVLAFFTDGAYAVLASRLRRWYGSLTNNGSMPRYASGAVYIGLGITTALAERR